MSEIVLQVLLFQGVVFCLLAMVLVCRGCFRQPVDRIRLTQVGFGLVIAVAVCMGFGVGPTWTIPLPSVSQGKGNFLGEGNQFLGEGNQSPLSLWERAGVRAVGSGENPHPNPLPEGEGTALSLASPTEECALSSTATSPSSRPYPLMEQEDKNIRAHHLGASVLLRAHPSAENQRAASEGTPEYRAASGAERNLRVPDPHVIPIRKFRRSTASTCGSLRRCFLSCSSSRHCSSSSETIPQVAVCGDCSKIRMPRRRPLRICSGRCVEIPEKPCS